MRVLHVAVAVCAYLAVLVQVSLLSQWAPLGAQPHLIALGAAVFLVIGRIDLGLVWMIIGAGLIDLLLPVRFGITLVPLLLAYAGVSLTLNRVVDAPSWLGTIAIGLLLTLAAELPLALVAHSYERLVPDLGFSLIILIPLASLATHPFRLQRLGLTIR